MADFLQNEIKQDEPINPSNPQILGDQTYVSNSGIPTGSGRSYGTAGVIATFTTDVSVSNTVTNTTLLSTVIPANTLRSNGMIRVKLFLYNVTTAGGGTFNITLYFGDKPSTFQCLLSILGPFGITPNNGWSGGEVDFIILGTSSPTTQVLAGNALLQEPGTDSATLVQTFWTSGTTTIHKVDITKDLPLYVTANFSFASTNSHLNMRAAYVEVI